MALKLVFCLLWGFICCFCLTSLLFWLFLITLAAHSFTKVCFGLLTVYTF